MDKHACIYIAGHQGMVGSAIVRALSCRGFDNLILRTSKEMDLRDNGRVAAFFAEVKPDHVFLAAAKVGGIFANSTFPAEFIYDNLAIQTNVIHQAYVHGVKKLLLLGSSCIYPRDSPQPMKEEYLLAGPLEPTNEWYAVAKIAGIKMCQAYRRQYGCDFVAVMPTNLYGPNDNFDLQQPMCWRRCFGDFTRRASRGVLPRYGARAVRGGNFCMWTIARKPVCF